MEASEEEAEGVGGAWPVVRMRRRKRGADGACRQEASASMLQLTKLGRTKYSFVSVQLRLPLGRLSYRKIDLGVAIKRKSLWRSSCFVLRRREAAGSSS